MLSNWNHNDIILTCLNKIEKPYNEKAEKGDNQLADKKNNQDLETTRRSYATRRLKIMREEFITYMFFKIIGIKFGVLESLIEGILV